MRKGNPFYRPEHDPKVVVWLFIIIGIAFIVYQVWEMMHDSGLIK